MTNASMTGRAGPPLPGVTTFDIDGRIVALAPESADVVFLNDTASAVWRLADGTRTLDELIAELAGTYGPSAATIGADVRAVYDSFVEAGLMTELA